MQIIETEFILVGGFDKNKREGLIKLYKVIYNQDHKKIKVKYIIDVDIDKYISNNKNENQKFKGFRGAISCISQSKKRRKYISYLKNEVVEGKDIYLFN